MSDLVDRDNVYKVLTDCYHHRTEVQHKALREALSKVPSAEPERKWIPVSECLPAEDVDVLLQFPDNMGVGYIEDGWWNIMTCNAMYSGLDEGDVKPIAWMPLPESYRGED